MMETIVLRGGWILHEHWWYGGHEPFPNQLGPQLQEVQLPPKNNLTIFMADQPTLPNVPLPEK